MQPSRKNNGLTFDNMTIPTTSAHRTIVSYIDKSRDYYLAKGFGNPYRWASHASAPFTPLPKPLQECRIGIITTAAPDEAGGIDRRVHAGPTNSAPDALHTIHLFWHKKATHTNDRETYLPLEQLRAAVADGRVGSLSPRFYGVPTKYSQRLTKTEHAPQILEMCRADRVDVALLVAL